MRCGQPATIVWVDVKDQPGPILNPPTQYVLALVAYVDVDGVKQVTTAWWGGLMSRGEIVKTQWWDGDRPWSKSSPITHWAYLPTAPV